jgi:enamine deaminase RidA (YjgF/YER057c/UK114 family)
MNSGRQYLIVSAIVSAVFLVVIAGCTGTAPAVPGPGNATTSHVGALQSPKGVCDTCTADPDLGMLNDWKVTLTKG